MIKDISASYVGNDPSQTGTNFEFFLQTKKSTMRPTMGMICLIFIESFLLITNSFNSLFSSLKVKIEMSKYLEINSQGILLNLLCELQIITYSNCFFTATIL